MSQPFDAAGSTVTATSIEIATAIEIVSARSENSCPSTPSMKITGTKTAIVVKVEASNAPATWRVPRLAASNGILPDSRSRTMFSATTTAASITMPTANARPASEITLRLRPVSSSTMKVASNEIGIAEAISKVARRSRRNHHRQPTASSTPAKRFPDSRPIARLMNSDESKLCSTPRPFSFNTPSRNSATTRLTSVSVASTLAPLSRSMRKPIAGLPF